MDNKNEFNESELELDSKNEFSESEPELDSKNEFSESELELDNILSEFHDLAEPEEADVEPDEELDALLHLPELTITPVTIRRPPHSQAEDDEAVPDSDPQLDEALPPPESMPPLNDDTIRAELTAKDSDALEPDLSADTITEEPLIEEAHEEPAPAFETEEEFTPSPILFTPRSRLRELKKKLVAGPEKRYYELSEIGLGKLQTALLVSLILVVLCAGVTAMFVLGMVPERRLRLVIFSQVLSLLICALMGCHLMMDSIGALFKGRFTVNTLLTITFFACMADAVFCLKELRVPCCAAFCLEMTMALWARLQRRSTEMAQMDTMRKAVRLNGIVKVDGYYEGKPGLLRTDAQVEDFMDTYDTPSAPEKFQSFYAFLSLVACIAIAVVAGMNHGLSMGVQIFSTALLVAVPASFFVSITRPMAILERRLHMVGSVLCGWKGVKGLSGKAVFPLSDSDLFPQGSTKLNGVKFYGGRDTDEIVSYTTSLISVAGGSLVSVFQQLLKSRGGMLHTVKNFQDYGSGGIGGEVCGEPVLMGSLNFLQDMGVEIPEGTMVNQAVYASIDGQLCAVYAISYAKMRSSAAGLVTLCGYRRLNPLLLCSDFMLTESFLSAKFNIKTRRILFPTREVKAQLKKVRPDPEAPVLAIATREELVGPAYAITGARTLATSTKLGVIIHLIGGILGMLIMLALAVLGSTELLTPTNVLLYQVIWAIPGLLVTEWTRTV